MRRQNSYFYIYKTTNLINGKIYVGQRCSIVAPDKDIKYFGSGVLILKSLKKYGKENFIKEILEECKIEELDEKEVSWVAKLNSRDMEIGYNLAEGGKGPKGYKRSPESVEANRQRSLGRKHKPETIEKIRIGNTGKIVSQETRDKIVANNTGRFVSKETGEKISKSNKGKKAWNEGLTSSIETRNKISKSKKGIPSGRKGVPSPESKNIKLREYWDNKELRAEHGKKLSAIFELREDVECPWCHKAGATGPMHKNHFDYCIFNPNKKVREEKTLICPYCGVTGHTSSMYLHHFENCKQNPNYREPEKVILTCPHCGFVGGGNGTGSMKRWHFDNCKSKPTES